MLFWNGLIMNNDSWSITMSTLESRCTEGNGGDSVATLSKPRCPCLTRNQRWAQPGENNPLIIDITDILKIIISVIQSKNLVILLEPSKKLSFMPERCMFRSLYRGRNSIFKTITIMRSTWEDRHWIHLKRRQARGGSCASKANSSPANHHRSTSHHP